MKLKVCVLSDYRGGVEGLLKRLSPNNDCKVCIDDFELEFQVCDDVNCDYVVVLNKVNKNTIVKTKRIIALQQEPYIRESKQYAIPFKNEWAISERYYSFCDIVLAFNDGLFEDKQLISTNPKTFIINNTKFIKHHPALYFLFGDMNYNDLCNLIPPQKTKDISCIASFDKKAFYGHLDRIKFVKALKESRIGHRIDFFGNKTEYELKEKKDGIIPYKYTIAIENNAQNDYVSEKIMDAYLGYSIPIYFGAGNADKYFPKNSFIKIDIYDLESSIKIIEDILDSDFYEKNFNALLEARKIVLSEYSMLHSLAKIIITDAKTHHNDAKKDILVPKYKRPLKYILKYWYCVLYYGFLKIITNGESKNKLRDLS